MKKLAVIISVLVCSISFSQDTIKLDGSNLEQIEDRIVELVNNYRSSKGLNKLVRKEIIDTFAIQHCNNMMLDFFKTNDIYKSVAHDLPGLTTKQRIVQFQSKYTESTGMTISGENCQAKCVISESPKRIVTYTAQEIFNRWKNCPGHNHVMLVKVHKYVGIDILIINDKTIVVSIDFGTDIADLITIEVR
jgi:uncharacterized protein YkwD